jgi:acetyl esterase/lipase
MRQRIAYGDDPLQFGDLTLPVGDGPFPVVVFIHGGFWRNAFGLDLAEPQAADAVANGFVTWNIEYRRVGDPGGGYPGTLVDIAAAVDQLDAMADEFRLDLDRVAVVGHSAGGHLSFWVGQRAALPGNAPGAGPVVVSSIVIGQAPVADLTSNTDLGGGAVAAFMGGSPAELPEAYDFGDPARLLPVRVPQLIVQGRDDLVVPPERAEAYVNRAGISSVDLMVFDGADHFDVIDPANESWLAVIERLKQEWG